ncbi:MAG: ExbD/TolR family protein [Moraxella sp.]|jgi:biopolymer transport protein ExbD
MATPDFDDVTQEFSEINVIPLVDVMLVLLTIVLSTATFVVNGKIPVDLPQARNAAAGVQAATILTITQDNQLYLNDQPISQLAAALNNVDKRQMITIRADGKIALARFVSISEDVKALGFKQVTLEVKSP